MHRCRYDDGNADAARNYDFKAAAGKAVDVIAIKIASVTPARIALGFPFLCAI
jgi:hypothetical protein